MTDNPFAPRTEFKKRVITVSVTETQQEAFDRIKAELEMKTDGAVIKHALLLLYTHLFSREGTS
ncbi:hypothetical protein DEU34_2253 [Microbacterium sp. AG1240]|uniref:hypothetical protein n=1 Tax=Microbacterium sp. AG1240 TaxID=2183992 RepID=UPI000EAD3CB9|nr:hypothetical protein [Microbacterium sp. AG1240]RKT33650.1 hypothetical protein DEU34_2253 [Microbacterium sp. AG1240]